MPSVSELEQPPIVGYQIRVRIVDVHPIIWRRFLFRADNTFADLHYAIQIAFNWSDDFLHRFKLQGTTIGIPRPHNYPVAHSAEILTLADAEFRKNQRFVYEYNFIDYWQIEVRIEKLCRLDSDKSYPLCIAGKRAAPPESCGGPAHFMRLRDQYSSGFIQERLAELGNILAEDESMIDGTRSDVEAYQNELAQLRYWLNIDKFNRRLANRRLRHYAAGDARWRRSEETTL